MAKVDALKKNVLGAGMMSMLKGSTPINQNPYA